MTFAPVFTERPALVGHRGMGMGVVAGHRENSVDSFQAAVNAGLHWVEVDVRRTDDDTLVVAHDPALPDGSVLVELTGAEAERRGALRLDTLLAELPDETGLVFDVKSSLADAVRPAEGTTAGLLAQACAGSLPRRRVLALSFDPAALRHMREAAPELALGLLTWLRFPIGQAVAAAAHLDVQVLAVHAGSLWRNVSGGRSALPPLDQILSVVHQSHRQLVVWCPSERRARSLVAVGVDALVVDDAVRHVLALQRWQGRRRRP